MLAVSLRYKLINKEADYKEHDKENNINNLYLTGSNNINNLYLTGSKSEFKNFILSQSKFLWLSLQVKNSGIHRKSLPFRLKHVQTTSSIPIVNIENNNGKEDQKEINK